MVRILALLLMFAPLSAAAGTYGASPPDQPAVVEVLPGWQEGDLHYAALRIRLAPGWKTYWRAPGDAGIPPSFRWDGSSNLAGVRFEWPAPHVFELNGLRSIGYKDELVLPMLLTAGRPGEPIRLRGEVDLGVCLDVCVPVNLRLDADLPPGGRPDPRIRAALAAQPQSAAQAGVSAVGCSVEPIKDGLKLTARLALPRLSGTEVVVVETGNPGIWVSDAATSREGNTLMASADLVPPEAQPFALDRSTLRFTVLGGDRAVDIRGCTGG